jgi:tRNA threonylcarbamoyladenosine biosynthesis protein TsaB
VRVLAIDTAMASCSVAVVDTHANEPVAIASEPMERGQAEALMPMLAEILIRAGGLGTIERIAVTTGPGSFTGLRIGLAAARGLGLVSGVPIVGLTTLTVLAAPYIVEDDRRPVAAAIDARHGRVFLHMFAPGGRTLVNPRCAPARDAARAIGTGPVRLIGSGAEMVAQVSDFPGGATVIDASPVPDIIWVARLGAAIEPAAAPPKPFYLLAPDARPQQGGGIARR